jgi:prophage antirepressor-like protein
MKTNPVNIISIFQEKEVRRIWHNEQWYFSVVDIVAVLSESSNPRRYWSDLKRKLIEEGYIQLYEEIVQLKLLASDGKYYETDSVSLKGVFRIIQSIPSPKAEPFKIWLAKVGQERIEEIQDPERAIVRAKHIYEQKGYQLPKNIGNKYPTFFISHFLLPFIYHGT